MTGRVVCNEELRTGNVPATVVVPADTELLAASSLDTERGQTVTYFVEEEFQPTAPLPSEQSRAQEDLLDNDEDHHHLRKDYTGFAIETDNSARDFELELKAQETAELEHA